MRISEDYYSVQGEGITQGTPSYFIRLQGCNLMCGGKDGELVKKGKATWHCDTEHAWKKGKEMTNEELLARIKNHSIFDVLAERRVHLVWTGGEPLLPAHQIGIRNFVNYINTVLRKKVYNEVETNGTQVTDTGFYGDVIQQVNCSPKLANSGIDYRKRVVPEAIKQIKQFGNSWFKFVVSKDSDIEEIEETYVRPFGIDKNKVILMPAVDNLEDLSERTLWLYETSKKTGYRGITRTHILAWGRTTGV